MESDIEDEKKTPFVVLARGEKERRMISRNTV